MNIKTKEGWTKEHTLFMAAVPIVVGIISVFTAYLSTHNVDFSAKAGFTLFLIATLICMTMAMVDIAADLWFDLQKIRQYNGKK